MSQYWKEYLWLMLIALCASAFRWPDIVRDKEGKLRWGLLALQLPVAFAIGVLAHATTPTLQHFFPYAGEFVAEGLTGVLSFVGPLGFIRLWDALVEGAKARMGGKQ